MRKSVRTGAGSPVLIAALEDFLSYSVIICIAKVAVGGVSVAHLDTVDQQIVVSIPIIWVQPESEFLRIS